MIVLLTSWIVRLALALFAAPPSYGQLLRHPKWIKTRQRITARDGHRCRNCGCRGPLEVHHIRYARYRAAPWRYPDAWLITLCAPCHRREHSL